MLARQGLVQPTGTGELTAWAFDAESWVTYACSALEWRVHAFFVLNTSGHKF
jgi:hypothetical protein